MIFKRIFRYTALFMYFFLALYVLYLFEGRMAALTGGLSGHLGVFFLDNDYRLISGAIILGCLAGKIIGSKKKVRYLILPALLVYIYSCQVYILDHQRRIGDGGIRGEIAPTVFSVSFMGFFPINLAQCDFSDKRVYDDKNRLEPIPWDFHTALSWLASEPDCHTYTDLTDFIIYTPNLSHHSLFSKGLSSFLRDSRISKWFTYLPRPTDLPRPVDRK